MFKYDFAMRSLIFGLHFVPYFIGDHVHFFEDTDATLECGYDRALVSLALSLESSIGKAWLEGL